MRILEEVIRGLVLFSLSSYVIMTCIELTNNSDEYFLPKLAVILLYICAILTRKQLNKRKRINTLGDGEKVSHELYMEILRRENNK